MKLIKFVYKTLFIRLLLIFLIGLTTTYLIADLTAPRVPLLGFHGVIDIYKPEDKVFKDQKVQVMNYPKQEMEKFLDYLLLRDFWFLFTQDFYDYFILKSKPLPPEYVGRKSIMLSFDDGYKTIHTNLLPILEKLEKKYQRKAKVVLFINPGNLDKLENNSSIHLTCNDLREGLQKGFYDVQSHGLTHKKLTEINNQDLDVELKQAQIKLRQCTQGLDPNHQVAVHFAYPFGATNSKVEKYTSKYYLSGYLYNSQIMKMGWLGSNYQIPRLTINRKHSPNRLIEAAERSYKLVKKEKG